MEKKTKFVEKIIKYELEPFPYVLNVVVSDDPQESRIRRNELFGHSYQRQDSVTALHSSGAGFSYIFLRFGADIGDITHEIFHFVWALMEWIGANHNNEVIAYYTGYYTREAAKFCYDTTEALGKRPKTAKAYKPRKSDVVHVGPKKPRKKVVKKS